MTHFPDASVLGLPFRKSSYSNGQENCVECATTSGTGGTVIRDSKDPQGPALVFPAAAWQAFVARVRDGGFPVDS